MGDEEVEEILSQQMRFSGGTLNQLRWLAPLLWKFIVFLAGAAFTLAYARFEFTQHQKDNDRQYAEMREGLESVRAEVRAIKANTDDVLKQHERMMQNENNTINAIRSYKEMNDRHFKDFIRVFEKDPDSQLFIPQDGKPVAQRRK